MKVKFPTITHVPAVSKNQNTMAQVNIYPHIYISCWCEISIYFDKEN